jgi:hypothetical protein
VESMVKIHSFYVSNIKNELVYVNQQYAEDEVCKMINDSIFLQFEEKDDEVDKSPVLDIPNHEVRVLIIERFFDLKDVVKGIDNENSDNSDDNSSNSENSDVDSDVNSGDSEVESNYNIEELI